MKEPSVGIFWWVQEENGKFALVKDTSELSSAEPYGDCLTHPAGHHEVWERWRRLPATARTKAGLPSIIVYREYEEFPRGRVVYHQASDRFWIYADRRLQQPLVLADIRNAFGLHEDKCVVLSDQHYR